MKWKNSADLKIGALKRVDMKKWSSIWERIGAHLYSGDEKSFEILLKNNQDRVFGYNYV